MQAAGQAERRLQLGMIKNMSLNLATNSCTHAMQAASEDELRVSLGLINYTTGKGKPSTDMTTRPIEVFMCSVVSPSFISSALASS